MRATIRLLPLFLRRSPRQAAGAIALCAAGVAVATLVGATVLAAYEGFGLREERVVWRDPAPAGSPAAAPVLQRRTTDWFDGRPIDRVDLATGAAPTVDLPVPPGLRSFPAAGTAYVSPALAELIRSHPSDELGDRFGGVAGEIGLAGLAHPDELVAVVGTTAAAIGPPLSAQEADGGRADLDGEVVAIDRFDTTAPDQDLQMYMDLALVAVVLTTVPAILLVGSAARLTAARREQRMAALRLAGASGASVRVLAAAETTIGAAIGAVLGVALSYLAGPLLADVPMAGGSWFRSDLALPAGSAVQIVLVAVAVCALTALVSLRGVARQPLGAARRAEPHASRWPRLLTMVGAILVLIVVTVASARGSIRRTDGQPADLTVPMVAALGVVIASLALVGPWVTSVVGRAMAAGARRTSMLIAGRRVLDDPRAAYRTVSAVVLAGLIAGFLAGIVPTVRSLGRETTEGTATMSLVRTDAEAIVADAAARPDRYGGAVFHSPDLIGEGTDASAGTDVPAGPAAADTTGAADAATQDRVEVTVETRGAALERLRTATQWARHGEPLVSSGDDVYGDVRFTQDAMRGSLAVLVAGLLLAAGASAVAAAASVVDQRSVIARLTLCGTDVSTLQRARQLQAVIPLVAATAGSVLLGLGTSVLLMVGFGVDSGRVVGPEVPVLVLVVGAAAGMGAASAALTRPLLTAAARGATSAGSG